MMETNSTSNQNGPNSSLPASFEELIPEALKLLWPDKHSGISARSSPQGSGSSVNLSSAMGATTEVDRR